MCGKDEIANFFLPFYFFCPEEIETQMGDMEQILHPVFLLRAFFPDLYFSCWSAQSVTTIVTSHFDMLLNLPVEFGAANQWPPLPKTFFTTGPLVFLLPPWLLASAPLTYVTS